MNYNKRAGVKLVKRPLQTPGLDSTRSNFQNQYSTNEIPNIQTQSAVFQEPVYQQNQQPVYQQQYSQNISNPMGSQYASGNQPYYDYATRTFQTPPVYANQQPGFTVPGIQIMTDPAVAGMAVQYGHALMGSGRQLVDREIEKYMPVSRLKYYYAVDTSYVSKKLLILLFPYIHSDWSVKYNQDEPIQPRYEVNAPDLYIPSMAFLTYILLAGLILGTSEKFSPEKLSIQASSALAWSALEVIVQLITLYITSIETNLKMLDLIAYSSYKYVGIIIAMLAKLFFGDIGYIIALASTCISFSFFLIRTLKLQVLAEPVQSEPQIYGMPQPSSFNQIGIKRRRYFLLFVALSQPFLMWWLSSNVI